MISAIVESNITRKKHIVDEIVSRNPKIVGIYRLTMKSNSDNFRSSAIQDIIIELKNRNIEINIYEPTLKNDLFFNNKVIKDLNEFKLMNDIIITNRYDDKLSDVKDKINTRDIFFRD